MAIERAAVTGAWAIVAICTILLVLPVMAQSTAAAICAILSALPVLAKSTAAAFSAMRLALSVHAESTAATLSALRLDLPAMATFMSTRHGHTFTLAQHSRSIMFWLSIIRRAKWTHGSAP